MSISPATVVQQQLDAYNAHDLSAWLATYAPDAKQFALHGGYLAHGHAQMSERMRERFTEPDLFAHLVTRTVMGNVVVDLELVTRNLPNGLGTVEMLCVYEVQDGLITQASFVMEQIKPAKDGDIIPINPASRAAQSLLAQLQGYLATLYPTGNPCQALPPAAESATATWFGCVVGGVIVGAGAVRIEVGCTAHAEIEHVFMQEDQRGNGYARALLARLEQYLQEQHIGVARLKTSAAQTAALALYQDLGYRRCAAFAAAVPNVIFMEKALSQAELG
jgi:putative hydrolase of HD superfamily